MKLRSVVYIALGFGLLSLSRALELRGDLAPFAESGVSGERLTWHVMALLVLVGAIGFFVSALVNLFRRRAPKPQTYFE
jgi:hypothetical protein